MKSGPSMAPLCAMVAVLGLRATGAAPFREFPRGVEDRKLDEIFQLWLTGGLVPGVSFCFVCYVVYIALY